MDNWIKLIVDGINWGWTDILSKLWPPLLAVILTQRFIEMRKPKLEICPEGAQPNTWNIFSDGKLSASLPYRMWRIQVEHTKIHGLLAWLIRSRETALRCKGDLTFFSFDGVELFKMQGRWASTPEISYLSPIFQSQTIMYPEAVDILYNDNQMLDCIVQFDNDQEAYGWNNESYPTLGKNPRCKLPIGEYRVVVRVSGQNFPQIRKQFSLVVSEDWERTSLE